MVDKWIAHTSSSTNGGGESGILRKKSLHQYNQIENRDDLLVFGYACKIFRDDEKALSIDQGKHLIPWMGEQSLKIDRYDVRATLHELAPYEPPPGGYTNRLDYLSPAEQKAEQLCEEERYYALFHNEMEEEIYQEEELKRLHQMRSSTFGQVGFNYESTGGANKSEENSENQEQEEPDEIYEKPAGFDVPESITLPSTMKEHAIIEKTARFISTQGAQMEILIKTKQSNNPQFNFLLQKNSLNPYYRHVLDTIKNGRYPSETMTSHSNETDDQTLEASSSYDDNSYNSIIAYRPPVTTLVYKPSADCAYTQLISKIKGVPLPLSTENTNDKSSSPIPQNYKNPVQNPSNSQPTSNPSSTSTTSDGVEVKKISTGLMLAQYYNSDSETEHESDENDAEANGNEGTMDFPVPPEALQHIIDKTAIYVIKNGKNFEDILKMKDPQRFSFLDADSEYHRYYIYKVTGNIPKKNEHTKNSEIAQCKIVTPVSFSIKSKDEQTIPIKPVLPQEASSEEEDDNRNENSLEVGNAKSALAIVDYNTTNNTNQTQIIPNALTNYPRNSDIPLIYPVPSTAIPIISTAHDLDTAESREKTARKIAEDKLRDRLAAAAREKLGLLSKEKQLQLERKKKAMAFLNQIKGASHEKTSASSSPIVFQTINDPSKQNVDIKSDNSDVESIHSIPTSPVPAISNDIEVKSERDYIDSKISSRSRSRSIRRLSRSRSRSKSSSSRYKKKKSKSSSHHHKKKSTKRKSRSRSRSRDQKYHKPSSSSSHRSDRGHHRGDRY